jgi:hypothetical protein
MKYLTSYLFFCCLIFSFFSCNSHHKDDSNKSFSGEVNSREEKEVLSQNTNAIGPFHWGINDDGYSKILTDWTKQLTKNGFVTIAGLKVKNNGIVPHYDKDEHLEKITIEFQKFSIHPEQDYTEEEKLQIEQIYLGQSKKIGQLIGTFSDIYGNTIENSFEDNSVEIYSLNGVKTIAQWQSKETHVSLNIQNKTFSGMTGCEMEMWIELKKIN